MIEEILNDLLEGRITKEEAYDKIMQEIKQREAESRIADAEWNY
jgi:hypothetical protein